MDILWIGVWGVCIFNIYPTKATFIEEQHIGHSCNNGFSFQPQNGSSGSLFLFLQWTASPSLVLSSRKHAGSKAPTQSQGFVSWFTRLLASFRHGNKRHTYGRKARGDV